MAEPGSSSPGFLPGPPRTLVMTVNAPLHAPASDTRRPFVQPETHADQAKRFVQLPNEVLFDHDLSDGAMRLYALLLHYARQSDRCWPSQERLAKDSGLCRRTIQRRIAELEAKGYVLTETRGQGEGNVYGLRKTVCAPEAPTERDAPRSLKELPHDEYLQTDHWKAVAAKARKRANFRCAVCGSRDDPNVYHRTYERKGQEEPDDLVVLCRDCHMRHHGKLPRLPEAEPEVRKDWRDE